MKFILLLLVPLCTSLIWLNAAEETMINMTIKSYSRNGDLVSINYTIKNPDKNSKAVEILPNCDSAFALKAGENFISPAIPINAGGPGRDSFEGKRVKLDIGESYDGKITTHVSEKIALSDISVIYSFLNVSSNEVKLATLVK